jgi:hypothetical protein
MFDSSSRGESGGFRSICGEARRVNSAEKSCYASARFHRTFNEQLRRGRSRRDLKYFLEVKILSDCRLDEHMQDLPDSHLVDAIGPQIEFDRKRAERNAKYLQ